MQSNQPTINPALGMLMAMFAGVSMPIQGQINGSLTLRTGDGVWTAFFGFVGGLICIGLLTFLTRQGRDAISRLPVALRTRAFPWWYMSAGVFGAFLVFTQSTTVSIIGIAIFTISVVTGQTLGGLVVDALGFGGSKRAITGRRILACAVMVLAVVWAVSPGMKDIDNLGSLILLCSLPLLAGLLTGFQVAMNGKQTSFYGVFMPAILFNFITGLLFLGVIALIRAMLGSGLHGAPSPLSMDFWLYLGGPLGVLFTAVSAIMARHVGVMVTSLGMIAGQLLGSLAVQALWPGAGQVHLATIGGCVVALIAVWLASRPGAIAPRGEKS